MKKKIDYHDQWLKALRERDSAIRERNDAIVRAEMPRLPSPKIEYIEKEVLPIGVAIFLFTFIFVCTVWMVSMYMSLKECTRPVWTPYEMRVTKFVDRDNIWKDRCQKAWKILEHHHSGPNNGRAFAVLDGK